MTDLYMPFAGLFLTIISFVLWIRHKRIWTIKEKLFLYNQIVFIVAIIVEIVYLLYTPSHVSPGLSDAAIIKYYLGTYVLSTVTMLLYISVDIFEIKKFRIFEEGAIITAVVYFFLTVYTDTYVEYHGEYIVLTGFPIDLLAYSCMGIALCVIVFAFIFRKKVNKWSRISIILYFLASVSGGVIVYLTGIHVAHFLLALALLIITLIIENSRKNYGAMEDTFDYELFSNVFNEKIADKINFEVLYTELVISSDAYFSEKRKLAEKFITDIRKIVPHGMQYSVFSGSWNQLYVVNNSDRSLEPISSQIREYINALSDDEGFNISAKLLFVPNARLLSSIADFEDVVANCEPQKIASNEDAKTFIFGLNESNQSIREKALLDIIDYALKHEGVILKLNPTYSIERNDMKSFFSVDYHIQTPENNIYQSSEIIPVIRKNNRSEAFERYVFRHLCNMMNTINESGNFCRLSIRLLESIENSFYTDELFRIFKQNGTNPSILCLELSNFESFDNKDKINEKLKLIKDFGFDIAVSGFGKGESNLNYLTDFPINTVKFDDELLYRSMADPKAAEILKNIIILAQRIGLRVEIVGIQNEAQKQFALSLKPDLIKGDYLLNDSIIQTDTGFVQPDNMEVNA